MLQPLFTQERASVDASHAFMTLLFTMKGRNPLLLWEVNVENWQVCHLLETRASSAAGMQPKSSSVILLSVLRFSCLRYWFIDFMLALKCESWHVRPYITHAVEVNISKNSLSWRYFRRVVKYKVEPQPLSDGNSLLNLFITEKYMTWSLAFP